MRDETNESGLGRPCRRVRGALTLAFGLSLVMVLHASGFSSFGSMDCVEGVGGNAFDFDMHCFPDYTDCSTKKLFVFLNASTQFLAGDHATSAHFEVDWDDGSAHSTDYKSDVSGHFYTSFVHEYAQNGTPHPKVYLYTDDHVRNCSHIGETVTMP
jgi:hypothetical protein